MPKALRLFLNDDTKLTVSTTVPTQIDTRVNKIQGANINIIDLSKRTDVEAVQLNLIIKEGSKPFVDTKAEEKEFNVLSCVPKPKSIIQRLLNR